MKRIPVLTTLTALVALWTMAVFGAVPQLINFQGILRDGSGNPVANGPYSVMFTIYDAPSAGNVLWTETQSVNTANGLFTVLLGSVTPVLDSLFNDSSRYLGVKVGTDPEMTPRQKLSSVGYSHNSSEWTSAGQNLFRLNGNVAIGTAVTGGTSRLSVYNSGNLFSIIGVRGEATNSQPFGEVYGGYFVGTSTGGGGGYGVFGSGAGSGVYGLSDNYGVLGRSNFTAGVYGEGPTYGVYGNSTTYGVVGVGVNRGVTGLGGATGVYGDGTTYGVYGEGSTYGAYGNSTTYGVVGAGGTRGVTGIGGLYGVYGTGNIGVNGIANISGGYGVWGQDGGQPSALAGRFEGNVFVTGTINKGAVGFKIDHPLDPANKYLYHSGVESPDMMNFYNGNIVTDSKGEATVTLPDWFGAVNKDFRYQLTTIGQFAQVIVSKEIFNNRFSIQTDKSNVKVSWQVTGIRQDAYAEAHRLPVEEMKSGKERGKYIHPKEHGVSETLGMNYEMNQKMAVEQKQMEEQQAKVDAERKLHEKERAKMEQERMSREEKVNPNKTNE